MGRYFTHITLQHTQSSNGVITIAIRLWYDYDTTTMYRVRLLPFDAIRREQKITVSVFRRSRIIVESHLW